MPNDHEVGDADNHKKQDAKLTEQNQNTAKNATAEQHGEQPSDDLDTVLSGGSGAVNEVMTALKRVNTQQRQEQESQLQELIARKLQALFEKERVAQHLWRAAWIKWIFRVFSVFSNALKLAHDTVSAIGTVIPPLSAAVTGMVSIFELIEARIIWKQKKEKKGRVSVRVITALAGAGCVIAAVILAVNPATAAIGAALTAAAIAVTVSRDIFFTRKTLKDIGTLKAAMARDTELGLPVDPEKAQKLKGLLALYEERKGARNANIAALVGTTLMALAAFALVANPVGAAAIGVVGVMALAVSSVIGCRNLYKKYQARKVAQNKAKMNLGADAGNGYQLYRKAQYRNAVEEKARNAVKIEDKAQWDAILATLPAKPTLSSSVTEATAVSHHNDVASILKDLEGSEAVAVAKKMVADFHDANAGVDLSRNSSTRKLRDSETSVSSIRSSVSSNSSSTHEDSKDDDGEGEGRKFRE